MNPWVCAALISIAGAIGGFANAVMTEDGLVLPKLQDAIWCPGFIGNVLTGAFAAFASWAFYGSGAGIEIAALQGQSLTTLRFSALAGAFLVGVGGAKWLTNEVDKRFLRGGIIQASKNQLTPEQCATVVVSAPREVLETLRQVHEQPADNGNAGTPFA